MVQQEADSHQMDLSMVQQETDSRQMDLSMVQQETDSHQMALLAHKGEALYGYEIAKQLAAADPDLALGKQGALYPVLRSLAEDKLLESWVEPSVAGPPRRYYRITAHGRSALVEWSHAWRRIRRLVEDIVEEGKQER